MAKSAKPGSQRDTELRARPFGNKSVAAAFASYPAPIRSKLMLLRHLIFETAAQTAGVGELEEGLRWGEPSFMTTQSRSGSAVRVGWKAATPDRYAMYFHCQTSLVATFRELYPHQFETVGSREITFDVSGDVPIAELRHCISLALTYHLDKPKRTTTTASSRRKATK